MDQKVDQRTLDRIVLIINADVVWMDQAMVIYGLVSKCDLKKLLQDLSLNQIYDIIFNNTWRFYTNIYGDFLKSSTRSLLLSIIENAGQRNDMNEMKSDIKTLTEKMAVLIDALSTIR